MREADLQRKIKAQLQSLGYGVWNLHGNMYQPGLPDLLVKRPGEGAIFVELKMPRGRLTKSQRKRFPELEAAGWDIWVITPDDDLEATLCQPANWRAWYKEPEPPAVDQIKRDLKRL